MIFIALSLVNPQIKVVPLHSIFLVYLDNLFTIVKLISAEMARKF